jgi:dihydropteroate synthase
MGIVNVTPDSFSDGGMHHGHTEAIARGRELAERGATIVDVGGESTRPGAEPVPIDEQLRRVLPVVERLAADGLAVSIDTRRAAVMRPATASGASIINDVSGLTTDRDSRAVAAASGARVVLVHMRGEPRTMQDDPRYEDVLLDVFDDLEARIEACVAAGISHERLVVDPGIGLGKRSRHNLALLRGLALFLGLGCPILLGVSRKGWTGWLERDYASAERLPASLAAAQWSVERGVTLLRVHDVAEHRQLLDAWLALSGADALGAPDPAAC